MKSVFNRRTKEIWIGVGVSLFAIVYLVASLYIKKSVAVSVGAEFMPRVYGFIMLLVGILQIITGISQYRTSTPKEKAEKTAEKEEKTKKTVIPVIAVFVIMIVCVALMNKLGFIISGAALTFGMCVLLTPYYEKRRYAIFVIFSIVLAFAVYYLFKNVLYVSLPSGILPF